MLKDFIWSLEPEPHASRRKEIMKKHGKELQSLFGSDPWTGYKTAGMAAFQLLSAYYFRDNISVMGLLYTYFVGAIATHNILLAIHEASHNLISKSTNVNTVCGLVFNIPMVVPYFALFKLYHTDHHKYQGHDVLDTDTPSYIETVFLNNTIGKLFYVTFQIIFYALRPILVNYKKPTALVYINWFIQITSMLTIYHYWGLYSVIYLLLSIFFAGSLHPISGHFIAEHYLLSKEDTNYETFSYYGKFNLVSHNAGYHNEHHDFPNVPGSRLPKLKEIASEFYDDLPQHNSYIDVLWNFITNPSITFFNRIKRNKVT